MMPMAVPGGQTLFEQGASGDALYTLVSGAVGVSVRDHAGRPTRIARLRPPETFGEMALLSDAPRAATVMALRDSHLLKLTREAFEGVIAEHPHTLLYFARMLADRLRARNDGYSVHHAPRIFTILSVTEGPDPAATAHELATALDALLPGETGCLTDWPDGADEAWFQGFENRHARTIFAAHEIDCPWCRQSQRRGDHILLLAEPGAPPRPGAAAYLDRVRSDWIRMDLVVRQDAAARRPKPLHPEVAALPAALRIQVRDGRQADLIASPGSSAARRGASSWAAGVPGASPISASSGRWTRRLRAGLRRRDQHGCGHRGRASRWAGASRRSRRRSRRSSPPATRSTTTRCRCHALTRGAKVDAGLAERYGGARIEDLWLPFFCVSSNLTTGGAMVHRSGDLPKALRASIAIPGLLPPVLCDEGVLVDGGMMNNLPADVAAELERGPVLAVDVGSDRAFQDMPRAA